MEKNDVVLFFLSPGKKLSVCLLLPLLHGWLERVFFADDGHS